MAQHCGSGKRWRRPVQWRGLLHNLHACLELKVAAIPTKTSTAEASITTKAPAEITAAHEITTNPTHVIHFISLGWDICLACCVSIVIIRGPQIRPMHVLPAPVASTPASTPATAVEHGVIHHVAQESPTKPPNQASAEPPASATTHAASVDVVVDARVVARVVARDTSIVGRVVGRLSWGAACRSNWHTVNGGGLLDATGCNTSVHHEQDQNEENKAEESPSLVAAVVRAVVMGPVSTSHVGTRRHWLLGEQGQLTFHLCHSNHDATIEVAPVEKLAHVLPDLSFDSVGEHFCKSFGGEDPESFLGHDEDNATHLCANGTIGHLLCIGRIDFVR
mmetsp:Transcript_16656/g.29751  ORF Transcript_16656/g.29751 Transcript_16656/m.29751 type:complete len:335 (+) Transcript_16656:1255-2259(+)